MASTKRPSTSDEPTILPDAKKLQRTTSSISSIINHYTGWTVPSNNHELSSIDTNDNDVASNNVTPRHFYQNYIQPRRPVVIKGNSSSIQRPQPLSDLSKLHTSWKDMEYLNQKAGDQTVMVERRSNTSEGYGQGKEVSMKFSQFIHLLQNGDDLHYLTTQDVKSNDDGRPDILPPFMKALSDDFPIQPQLMGNLIPQNINLWMGNDNNNNNNNNNNNTTDATTGSSSGLHHDYHDNLYIVLKGRKRFRLFSPRDTQYLYTRGNLLKVHPNGRINYVDEETTPYGADLGADAAAKAAMRQRKAEERLEQVERAVQEGIEGAEDELEKAEEELENAMDALIDLEDDDCDDDESVEDDVCETLLFSGKKSRLVDKTVKNPNNFSRIPTEMLDDLSNCSNEYPLLQKAKMAYCYVNAGEMLYLPASWFHEVTSYGGEGTSCHLALNYW